MLFLGNTKKKPSINAGQEHTIFYSGVDAASDIVRINYGRKSTQSR